MIFGLYVLMILYLQHAQRCLMSTPAAHRCVCSFYLLPKVKALWGLFISHATTASPPHVKLLLSFECLNVCGVFPWRHVLAEWMTLSCCFHLPSIHFHLLSIHFHCILLSLAALFALTSGVVDEVKGSCCWLPISSVF